MTLIVVCPYYLGLSLIVLFEVFMADLQRARQLIAGAKHIAVLTGAGISAESGVAMFRDTLTG